jgi:glutamate racemase
VTGHERAPSTVGVLDSGVGGLSVLRHLRVELPGVDVLYVADAAWCPYGPRSPATVRRRVFAVAERLIELGADAVVVACNTASTVALAGLRDRFPDRPFVGMEPAVKPAAALTERGAIGVLATAITARGEALARLVDRYGRGVAVHVAVPDGLVELVEAGEVDGPTVEAIVGPILARWRDAGVDAVVLGCTHYPFALGAIERAAGPSVRIVDPGPAVARQAARVLAASGRLGSGGARGRTRLLTSGDPAELRAVVARLLPAPWTREAKFASLGV